MINNKGLLESFIDKTIEGPVLSMEKVRTSKLNTFKPLTDDDFSSIRKQVFPNADESDAIRLCNDLTDEGFLTVILEGEQLVYPKTLYALSQHARRHHSIHWHYAALTKAMGLLPLALGYISKTAEFTLEALKAYNKTVGN